ncbi:type II toxin-antitoxin system RelE/ParE family toxin [Desulfovibrio sp. ZJ200]|uniref:type II toxin-antitoxin system RelE/ParE family toxin n=1 Tax=Desulfovibrio sp. ZJ200 TaxID=2709792 RepID=UPI0013EAE28D|nr:type II toxin-antitoxin system RelE/ParE family toxin [Desulfovibrio sp. ZJ200]
MEIIHYRTEDGTDIYQRWVDGLRDTRAKVAILRRVDRAAAGNFGDHKFCRDGVYEMRIDLGPGYRVYYFQHQGQLVVVLCGGDKQTQDADISRAVACRADFLRRINKP